MSPVKSKENIKNEVLQAFNFRHATKVFDSTKKISDEDFQYILETGRLSPSSFGMEPWKFVVVQEDRVREKLKSISWGATRQLTSASHFVLILARTAPDMRYDSEYISYIFQEIMNMPKEVQEVYTGYYKNFQQKEFRLLESDRAMFDWSSKQTYLPLANMMTSAALIGIDSCPMEGFNPADINAVLSEEGLTEDGRFQIAAMVAFGYRQEDPREKIRRPMESVVQWV